MKKPNSDENFLGVTKLTKSDIFRLKEKMNERIGMNTLLGLLEAAGYSQRLKILYLLQLQNDINVADIASVLGITDSAVSQHLRKLKDQKIVKSVKKRQTVYYSVVKNPFTDKLKEFFEMKELDEEFGLIATRRENS
ncbi:MAG: metalloregulator ArsR/SmtB family transcription factor [Bacteroidetes bacterium]|nr:metalloregulator ArsR/SmtB family transcription factor [Bacteroidota bacterium]MCL5738321.1 metalloregulator ArsR/SmtB family transcription factor [Bacteroidota bacterium]